MRNQLTRLERRALGVVLPDPHALDCLALDKTDLNCLALVAKGWLLSIGISPELTEELRGPAGDDALAVIGTATSLAKERGTVWPWNDYLRTWKSRP